MTVDDYKKYQQEAIEYVDKQISHYKNGLITVSEFTKEMKRVNNKLNTLISKISN